MKPEFQEDKYSPLDKKELFELKMISFVFILFIILGAFIGYTKFSFWGSTVAMMFVFAFLGGALISIFYEIKNLFIK